MRKGNGKGSNKGSGKSRTNTRSNSSRRGSNQRDEKTINDSANLNKVGRDNDPNWYFTSPELADQASQLSFQNMLGFGNVIGEYQAPTICKIYLNPCPGITYQIDDANNNYQTSTAIGGNMPPAAIAKNQRNGINLMSAKLYTLLSTFTGRTSNYGPQDIAIMILSISQVAAISEHIRRTFGIAMTYNVRNRFLPLQLIESLGFDAEDLMANIANYRMQFNICMSRINQIPLLDNIGFIRKCRDMYQHVYVDEPSTMAQMYVFVPATTWILDETKYSTGSYLKTVYICDRNGQTDAMVNGSFADDGSRLLTNNKMQSYLNLLNEMITRVLESSTLNIIYADILNAASKLNVPTWSFDYLAENYVVMPEYNRNALLQIHNIRSAKGMPNANAATVVGGSTISTNPTPDLINSNFKCTYGNDVVSDPDNNQVFYNPVWIYRNPSSTEAQYADFGYQHDLVIDMDTDNPSVEDRIEALRFVVAYPGYGYWNDTTSVNGPVPGKSRYFAFPALPDHYVVGWHVDYNEATHPRLEEGASSLTAVGPYIAYFQTSDSNPTDVASDVARLTPFKYRPGIYCINRAHKESDVYYPSVIQNNSSFELMYYTTVDYKYINRLLKLMYTGLFDFRV